MCNKDQNTDLNSPRLFPCEYMKITVGDDYDGVSADLSATRLTDLLVPITDEWAPRTAVPRLLESERERYSVVIKRVKTREDL